MEDNVSKGRTFAATLWRYASAPPLPRCRIIESLRWWLPILVGLTGCSTLSGLDDYRVGLSQGGAGAGGDGGSAGAGGCEAELDNDPRNCGVCGHDCRDGGCVGGECQPYTIVEGELEIIGIALSDTHIYWTTGMGGAVRRRALDGSGDIESLYIGWPVYLDVWDDQLYWADYGSEELYRSNLDGSGETPLGMVELASGMAVDEQGIYSTQLQGTGDIMFRTHASDTFMNVVGDLGSPEDVALAGSRLYWTESTSGLVMYKDLPDGTPTTVAQGQNGPSGIAVDDAHVYWAVYSGDQILRAPLDDLSDVEVIGTALQPTGVTLVGDTIYWGESATGTIWALTK